MQQKSPEWFAARVGKVTGSRIGAILGHNPHKTRDGVMRDMVREALGLPSEFAGNDATRHGENYEPVARRWYEQEKLVTVEELGLIQHKLHPDLAVSPDGLVEDGDSRWAIEIKCPYWVKRPYSVFDPKKRHYLDQCLLLAEVLDVQHVDFVCWISDDNAIVERVDRDELFLETSLPVINEFLTEFRTIVESPNLHEQYRFDAGADGHKAAKLVKLDPEFDRLSELSIKLDALDRESRPIRDEVDRLKKIVFARHQDSTNGAVIVRGVERKGHVDYPKVLEFTGATERLAAAKKTLDDFRKKSSFFLNIEVCNEH